MSHTNATNNYELSQFVGSDKPAWLVDYNGDMLKIDNAIGGVASDLATAQGDISDINAAIGAEGLSGRVTEAENDITDINTKIGNTELPTTAQTLTGAIAEAISDIGDVDTALGVVRNTAGAAQTAANAANQLAYTIADVYDSSETYAIGDYAIYQNTLYRCVTAITVGEVFDPAKWTSVKVMNEFVYGILERQVYTATHDGTKTNADLVDEAISNLAAYLVNASSNIFAEINSIKVGGIVYGQFQRARYYGGSSLSDIGFVGHFLNASASAIEVGDCGISDGTMHELRLTRIPYDGSTITTNTYDSNIATSDVTIRVDIFAK